MRHNLGTTMKKAALVSVIVGVLATNAYAAGEGGFLEAGVGNTTFKTTNTSGWTLDNKDTSYSILGGYNVNPYVGLEAGYLNLGKESGSIAGTISGNAYGKLLVVTGTVNVTGDAKGWLFGVRGTLPINDQFSLNGRVGLYNWDSDVKVTANAAGTWGGTAFAANATASQSYSKTDTYYALGAKYSVNKQLSVGLDYFHVKLSDLDTKADNLGLSLSYKF